MSTAIGAIAFIVLMILMIFLHELGHYATAKWAGIKVRQFFVGFGPTLWSYRRGRPEVVEDPKSGELVERPETEYGVKAFPLGGFVKIAGMSVFEDVSPQDQPRSFPAAPAWKRAIVLGAGSFTHFATAFVLLFVVFSVLGFPNPGEPTRQVEEVVTELEDGSPAPAAKAGMRPGDEIVAVDGRPVRSWDGFREFVQAHPEDTFTLTVDRDGRSLDLSVTPAVTTNDDGETIGVVGLLPAPEIVKLGLVEGVVESGRLMGQSVVAFVEATPRAFSPENIIPSGDTPSDERAISIYGAGRIAADIAGRGDIVLFLFFFVQINLFIGLLNLLPLPPLDGGHLLILGIEKVRGKPVDQHKVLPIMAIVTSLLIVLAVALLIQDILNPVSVPIQ